MSNLSNTTIRLDDLKRQINYVDSNINSVKIKEVEKEVAYQTGNEYYIAKGLYLSVLPLKEVFLCYYHTTDVSKKITNTVVYDSESVNAIIPQNTDKYDVCDHIMDLYEIESIISISESEELLNLILNSSCNIFKLTDEYCYYPLWYEWVGKERNTTDDREIIPTTNTNNETTDTTENSSGIFVNGVISSNNTTDTSSICIKCDPLSYEPRNSIIINFDDLVITTCNYVADTSADSNDDSGSGSGEDYAKIGLIDAIENYVVNQLGINSSSMFNSSNVYLKAHKYYVNDSDCANNTTKPLLYTVLNENDIKNLTKDTLQNFYSNSVKTSSGIINIDYYKSTPLSTNGNNRLEYKRYYNGNNSNNQELSIGTFTVANRLINSDIYSCYYFSNKTNNVQQGNSETILVTFKGYEEFRIGFRLTYNTTSTTDDMSNSEIIYVGKLNSNTDHDIETNNKIAIHNSSISDAGNSSQYPITKECVFENLDKDKEYHFYIKDVILKDFNSSDRFRESYIWFQTNGINEYSNEDAIQTFLKENSLSSYYGNLFISDALKTIE